MNLHNLKTWTSHSETITEFLQLPTQPIKELQTLSETGAVKDNYSPTISKSASTFAAFQPLSITRSLGRRPAETDIEHILWQIKHRYEDAHKVYYLCSCAGANYTTRLCNLAILLSISGLSLWILDDNPSTTYHHFRATNMDSAKIFGVIVHSLITTMPMIHGLFNEKRLPQFRLMPLSFLHQTSKGYT